MSTAAQCYAITLKQQCWQSERWRTLSPNGSQLQSTEFQRLFLNGKRDKKSANFSIFYTIFSVKGVGTNRLHDVLAYNSS